MVLIGGGVFLVLLFVLLFVRQGGGGGVGREVNAGVIKVMKDGREVSFDKSGVVTFRDGEIVFSQIWVDENGLSVFDYLKAKIEAGELLGGEYAVSWNGQGGSIGGDSVIDEVFGGFDDGGGDEGGDGGGDIGDVFDFGSSPTPTPTKKPSGGGSSGGIDDCPFWRLSYCVYPFTTPSPSPQPQPTGEILPPECEYNLSTGRTVIGDELCVPTPTPFPTP